MSAAAILSLLSLAATTVCTAVFGVTGKLLFLGLAGLAAVVAWQIDKRWADPYARYYAADWRATRRSVWFRSRRRDD